MNENKKLYILLGAIAAIIILILGINFVNEQRSKKYLNTFNETISKTENKIIFLGRETCGYCQMFSPLLESMSKKYGFEYLYVDTDKLTPKALNGVLAKLNIDSANFGTPHLSITNNGKVVDEISGYADDQELMTFLKENGFIDESAVSLINYVSFDEYKELIQSSTNQIIVIGQTGCSHCMSAKPALLSIADKYNVKINYFNVSELSSGDNSDTLTQEFNNTLSYFTEEEWGTPVMLIVKDKKVVTSSSGFISEDTYVKFLKDNSFIGE